MNEEIQRVPTEDEVRYTVMGLNRDSAAGPDGITRAFFQDTWDIIKEDLHNMVKVFFAGEELHKFITHTNLVLLPKKLVVQIFLDLRPISLSNFMNKVFSRFVHERLKNVLPLVISQEQAGFVQGRSITKNVFLVQEIIAKSRKGGKLQTW